jgi:hypothetical protein
MLGKLNCYVVRAGIFLIMGALVAGIAGCFYTPPSQNLEIRTWYDLEAVWNNLAGHHTLMNDLDSTTLGYEELASPRANQGKGWEPIGTTLIQHHGLTTFVGTFDGQGYEIRDLLINRPDEDAVGLFGYVGQGGVIKDIGVVNAAVTGERYVGIFGIVGLGGRIEDIGVVNATVTGDDCVGGLAGWNLHGTVSNAYSSGSVTGNYYVGGLVGANERGTVSESYSTCNVTGDWRVGGLVGENDRGTVTNCYSTGDAIGNSSVGGLVGQNYESGAILNSYSTGTVTGNYYVGGLVGSSGDTVMNSFWDTQTSGQATSGGGRGKNTTEMQDVATFSGVGWNITTVAFDESSPSYIWNIVNGVTCPFLSWQS